MSKAENMVLRPVHRFEGLYSVSSDGRVFENSSGNEVKQHMAFNGTMYVQLAKNGTVRNKKVAFIVAQAFVKNPDKLNLKTVRHHDGNKQNNKAENIYWTKRGRKDVS